MIDKECFFEHLQEQARESAFRHDWQSSCPHPLPNMGILIGRDPVKPIQTKKGKWMLGEHAGNPEKYLGK